MKTPCEIIRDLLPLYTDDVCSDASRSMVEEHLQECAECRDMLTRLRETELESRLLTEKNSVIDYGTKRFRRQSAAAGSAVSGLIMIPVIAIMIFFFLHSASMDWMYILIAALALAASLTVVPILVPQDKAFWTFCAFCASLILLLGVTCLYSHGTWFWIASSAVLFGLSVIFLPFLIRTRPLKALLGSSNRVLVVLGVDTALFLFMMKMISLRGRNPMGNILMTVIIIAGIAAVVLEVIRKRQ